MKKRILLFIALMIVCSTLFCSLGVGAVTPLDVDAKAGLTLKYQKNGNAFSGLSINIYRVAEAFSDGSFELVDPYSSYPVNIHDVTKQEQWTVITSTLDSYIVANKLLPDRTLQTNENGIVDFKDLKTGLYLVQEVIAENESGTYIFNKFMVYLPTPQADGSFDYEVEAKPKCTNFVPKDKYTVTKLWQDGGNQELRPADVTVDIYKDGELFETKNLNAENNWSYTWYVSADDQGKWTVAERSVTESYKVTVQQNGNTFSIINTRETEPDAPQTGNSFTPLPWILGMCLSGGLMLAIGIYDRRCK